MQRETLYPDTGEQKKTDVAHNPADGCYAGIGRPADDGVARFGLNSGGREGGTTGHALPPGPPGSTPPVDDGSSSSHLIGGAPKPTL